MGEREGGRGSREGRRKEVERLKHDQYFVVELELLLKIHVIIIVCTCILCDRMYMK